MGRDRRGTARILVAATSACLAALSTVPRVRAADEAAGPGAPRVIHDPAYFRDQVLPLLERHCMGCHDAGDMQNKSRHRLERRTQVDGKPAWTEEGVRRNYEMLVRLLDARQ